MVEYPGQATNEYALPPLPFRLPQYLPFPNGKIKNAIVGTVAAANSVGSAESSLEGMHLEDMLAGAERVLKRDRRAAYYFVMAYHMHELTTGMRYSKNRLFLRVAAPVPKYLYLVILYPWQDASYVALQLFLRTVLRLGPEAL